MGGETVMEVLKINRLPPDKAYQSLGLTRNPFPSDGTPLDPPRIVLYPDEQLKQELETFLSSLLHRDSGAKGRVLIGNYGSGKTYYLKNLQYFLGKEFPEVATFYVEHPGYGFHDFCGSVVGAIGLANITKKVWSIIKEELLKKLEQGNAEWYFSLFPSSQDKLSMFPKMEYSQILSDYRNFLDQAKKRKADPVAILSVFSKTLEEALDQSEGAMHKLSRLLIDSHYGSYFDWQDISTSKQKEIGDYEFLATVFLLLSKTDKYKTILILVDEFEEVTASERFSSKEATNYEYTMRRLLDLVSRTVNEVSLGMVIAMTPVAWNLTNQYCKPLASRLLRPIWIKPLSEEHALKIIKAYLNDARDTKDDSINPLPKDFLTLIPEFVKDNPRNLLNYCHEVIEAAANKHASDVSVNLVKQYSERWKAEFATEGK
jgi:hypothetical protein